MIKRVLSATRNQQHYRKLATTTANKFIITPYHSSATVRAQQQSHEEDDDKLIKPHLNFPHLVQHEQTYIDNVKNRLVQDVDVSSVVKQYKSYTVLLEQVKEVRNWRRLIADYLANKLKPVDLPASLTSQIDNEQWKKFIEEREASDKKQMTKEEKELWKSKGKELKELSVEQEHQLSTSYRNLLHNAIKLPNLTHPDTPIGEEPTLIEEIRSKQDILKDKKKILDHYEICMRLDLADFDRASLIAGSKFYYLKNEGVLLEFALIQYALNKLIARGFIPTTTPELVRKDVIEACGFQPRGEHNQIYMIQDSPNELCLTGTSEISVAGMFANRIIENFDPLPQKICAVSHCFRTEAGAGGKRDKGLYRVHQFTKIEMFAVTSEKDSEEMFKHLVSIQKEIFTELGFHFQILNMPSTDLGAPAYNKTDIEAFIPSRDAYGELSSASNCTDYQSRRLNIRHRVVDPETKQQVNAYVHTLNATAIAVPRTILAILESHQFETEDGRLGVKIPEVLRPFMNNREEIVEKVVN
jgi:seryl-tRNA synthetase